MLLPFFPPERIRRIAWVWILVSLLAYAGDIARSFDGATFQIYRAGNPWPLGGDFLNFWSGPALALQGRAQEIYDWARYVAFHQELTHVPSLDPHLYNYPPPFLLATLPLGLLPYGLGLFVWIAGGLALFVLALKKFAPSSNALFLTLASPAVFINALAGQNGTLSAALMGGGLALLRAKPWIAGALFGLLSIKPQLGVLIPFALLASRSFKAFAAAALTSGALYALSFLVFGSTLWHTYATHADMMRTQILENPTEAWNRFVSIFITARMAGASVLWAYVLQAVGALFAVALLFREGRNASPARLACLLILGTFWATPYVQDYDMPILTFACLALAETERETGNRAPTLLFFAQACLLIAPLFIAPLVRLSGWAFDPGPFFPLPAFALLLRSSLQKAPNRL